MHSGRRAMEGKYMASSVDQHGAALPYALRGPRPYWHCPASVAWHIREWQCRIFDDLCFILLCCCNGLIVVLEETP